MEDDKCPKGSTTDEAEAATKAFDGLRKAIDRRGAATEGELKLIRQGVEALFDQVEALQARPDLAQDMAELRQTSLALAERLKAMETMPTLKGGVLAFERAGADLLRASVKTLEQKAQRLDRVACTLESITQGLKDRGRQRVHFAFAGTVGLLSGALLLLFLSRLLPFNTDTHVAAGVMGKPRWEAGATIMHAANPAGWSKITADAQLGRDNADSLAKCRQAAFKSRKPQRCIVKVAPPRDA